MRVALSITLAAAMLTACTQAPQQAAPTNDDEKAMYALGALMAEELSPFSLSDKELALVKSGLTDAIKGKEGTKPEDLQAYMPELQRMSVERPAAKAKKEGAEFAAKVAQEPGAEKTDSGLIYKSLKEGTGASPTATDKVRVHYVGKLVDGTQFDSSRDRGEPTEFPLDGVIPCWTEGVQKMKVGGLAQLVCPSDIAYGDRSQQLPPGSTLNFEVELLDIVKPAAAK